MNFGSRTRSTWMPFIKDLGIRSNLWVVTGMAHAVPGEGILTESEKTARRRCGTSSGRSRKKRPFLPPAMDFAPSGVAGRAAAVGGRHRVGEEDTATVARCYAPSSHGGFAAFHERSPASRHANGSINSNINERLLTLAGKKGGLEERTFRPAQAEARGAVRQEGHRPCRRTRCWRISIRFHPRDAKAATELRRLSGAAQIDHHWG